MSGPERKRRLDLDAEPVPRNAYPVVRAVHGEAAGRYRLEIRQACRHPVPGLDGFEGDAGSSFRTGRLGYHPPYHGLVRRVLEMELNAPVPVGAFEGRGRSRVEALRDR